MAKGRRIDDYIAHHAAIMDKYDPAKRVWLATDCDREGQLIGQEILEHTIIAAW